MEKRQSSKPGRGIVKNLNETIDDNDRVVMSIDVIALMAGPPCSQPKAGRVFLGR
jgi:hypothetical protein